MTEVPQEPVFILSGGDRSDAPLILLTRRFEENIIVIADRPRGVGPWVAWIFRLADAPSVSSRPSSLLGDVRSAADAPGVEWGEARGREAACEGALAKLAARPDDGRRWAPATDIAPAEKRALTPHQRRILRLMSAGHTTAEIARGLGSSAMMVEREAADILRKLSQQPRAQTQPQEQPQEQPEEQSQVHILAGELDLDPTALRTLTEREREVAELVADGKSNREIAEELSVSKRTIDAHVDHAFSKLNVNSRQQLTALIITARLTAEEDQ